MTICVEVDQSGALFASEFQQAPCSTAVLMTPEEWATIHDSPLNLSVEDGVSVSVAILGVWAVAWSFRALVKALNVDGEVNE